LPETAYVETCVLVSDSVWDPAYRRDVADKFKQETAKLNGVDSQAWLAYTLARIPDYRITQIDELLS
jgi:hypothetical protein